MKSIVRSHIAARVAFGILSAVPRIVEARTCAAGSDCPRGFECVQPGSGAAGLCLATSCVVDSDCAPGFRCGPAGTQCVTPADGGRASCSPRTNCTPEWQVPCQADADCGTGYTCSGTAGLYECGSSKNDPVPSYATATTVACSDVPGPPDPRDCTAFDGGCSPLPAPFRPSPSCDAGTTCVLVSWKTCETTRDTSCRTKAECPSGWSCACPPCGPGGLLSPSDAGALACSPSCAPPNSDLANGGNVLCLGGPGPSVSAPRPGPPLGGADARAKSGAPDASAPDASGAASPPSVSSGCATRRASDAETPSGLVTSTVALLAMLGRLRRRYRETQSS
jgi:hypothetical protein